MRKAHSSSLCPLPDRLTDYDTALFLGRADRVRTGIDTGGGVSSRLADVCRAQTRRRIGLIDGVRAREGVGRTDGLECERVRAVGPSGPSSEDGCLTGLSFRRLSIDVFELLSVRRGRSDELELAIEAVGGEIPGRRPGRQTWPGSASGSEGGGGGRANEQGERTATSPLGHSRSEACTSAPDLQSSSPLQCPAPDPARRRRRTSRSRPSSRPKRARRWWPGRRRRGQPGGGGPSFREGRWWASERGRRMC